MARTKAKPIRRTVGKGGNYRKTKAGAGMSSLQGSKIKQQQ